MKIKNLKQLILSNLSLLVPFFILIPLYIVLYKIYMPRINAFGCFDDCNNFLGGYYLLAGKQIFSDFFFNHQPFAAHLSALIQAVSSPENIFELILRHRQFVLLFSFLFNILLILRFRIPAFIFVLIYEPSKFYIFGDRFLAEGIIVYPLVYMTGIALYKLSKIKLLALDYYLVAIFTWFVIYMREPVVPLALLLFALILFEIKIKTIQVKPILLFAMLTIVTLLSFNIPEFFFNVVTVNYQAVLPSDIKAEMFGNRFLQSFFYPLYIFFYGNFNLFHQLLLFINVAFLANIAFLIYKRKYVLGLLILIILSLANIRVVIPGSMYYEAFHMIVWFGLFIFSTSILIYINSKTRHLFYFSTVLLFLGLAYFVSSKSYFPKENFDQHSQLLENYGEVMQQGNVISALASPGDTMFLDASDDMLYWQAKLPSPYKYTWYTSAMPHFPKYTDARIEMFEKNPPTFYKEYGSCPKKGDVGQNYRLPDKYKAQYIRLNVENKPSCLYVRKDKIDEITAEKWKKAAESLYYLPGNKYETD